MSKNQKGKKEIKRDDTEIVGDQERKIQEKEIEEKEDAHLKNWGQMTLEGNEGKRRIHLLSIIGEMLREIPRQRNMIMCCRLWPGSKMIRPLKGCWFF